MKSKVEIRDIRSKVASNTDEELKKLVLENLHSSRRVSSLLLYDAHGLELYEKASILPSYYLFWAELQILKDHAGDLAKNYIADSTVVVELGSGPLHKTSVFLDALNTHRRNIKYYALDLSAESLTKSLSPLTGRYANVTCAGLHGTYDDGMEFLRFSESNRPKLVTWMGSSIGNMTRSEAIDFLARFRTSSMNPGDLFLCGIDRRNSHEDVKKAYGEPAAPHADFAFNALTCANNLFGGKKIFDKDKFEYESVYYAEEGWRASYLKAKEDMHLADPVSLSLKNGERLGLTDSYKYNEEDVEQLVTASGFTPLRKWADKTQRYDLHLWKV